MSEQSSAIGGQVVDGFSVVAVWPLLQPLCAEAVTVMGWAGPGSSRAREGTDPRPLACHRFSLTARQRGKYVFLLLLAACGLERLKYDENKVL